MSVTTGALRPAARLPERLLDALADPVRGERNATAVLLVYAGLWTLYGAIAKGSQDIHTDMSEQFVLGRELALGYAKHPPLAILIVRLWFAVFPAADWAYYLLASANAALALWIAWRISARFLSGEKRALGLALLMLVPFFNFHALKFNANAVLMPLWAATTLFFLRSFETRRALDAALAGISAAAAMYGKYWSVVLLLGLALAALTDARRVSYFRSPAPWITVAFGAAAMAPHVIWLVANDFAPFSYAMFVHGEAPMRAAVIDALGYLAGSAAYVFVPLLIVLIAARPSREMLADMAWPRDRARRLAAAAFWATLLLPAVFAPVMRVHLTSLWSMSAWTLLPVMLLSSPLVSIRRVDIIRAVAIACALPLAMIAVAPAIAFAIHGNAAAEGHSSLLAKPIEQLWRETTDRPLKIFEGTDIFGYGVPFYLRSHPVAFRVLERSASAQEEARIAEDGVVLLCPMSDANCINAAQARAARVPASRRREIEVSRNYLGFPGKPARYLVIAIPPLAPPGER